MLLNRKLLPRLISCLSGTYGPNGHVNLKPNDTSRSFRRRTRLSDTKIPHSGHVRSDHPDVVRARDTYQPHEAAYKTSDADVGNFSCEGEEQPGKTKTRRHHIARLRIYHRFQAGKCGKEGEVGRQEVGMPQRFNLRLYNVLTSACSTR